MGRVSNYPPELRARAMRMVAEVTPDYPSQWAAITAVSQKLGIGTAETLRKWIVCRDNRGRWGLTCPRGSGFTLQIVKATRAAAVGSHDGG